VVELEGKMMGLEGKRKRRRKNVKGRWIEEEEWWE
jgi:hypothetical protein